MANSYWRLFLKSISNPKISTNNNNNTKMQIWGKSTKLGNSWRRWWRRRINWIKRFNCWELEYLKLMPIYPSSTNKPRTKWLSWRRRSKSLVALSSRKKSKFPESKRKLLTRSLGLVLILKLFINSRNNSVLTRRNLSVLIRPRLRQRLNSKILRAKLPKRMHLWRNLIRIL